MAGIVCLAAIAIVVAVAHVVAVEAMSTLDWGDTNLAVALAVEAIVVVVLVDCP